MGNLDFQNIHVLASVTKKTNLSEVEDIQKYGIVMNAPKQKRMVKEFSKILYYDALMTHPDLCTASEWGIDDMVQMTIEQLGRFYAPEDGNNSGHGPTGKRVKRPFGGKIDGENDDMADAILLLFETHQELTHNRLYRPQMTHALGQTYLT